MRLLCRSGAAELPAVVMLLRTLITENANTFGSFSNGDPRFLSQETASATTAVDGCSIRLR